LEKQGELNNNKKAAAKTQAEVKLVFEPKLAMTIAEKL
jgi:hypothetical protein